MKVGVGLNVDELKLYSDYGFKVNGILDLRYLAVEINLQGESLAKMASKHIGVNMGTLEVRGSNWQANALAQLQKEYAAMDVIVPLELFLHFKKVMQESMEEPTLSWTLNKTVAKYLDARWDPKLMCPASNSATN